MQQYVIFNVLKEYCIPKDELFYRFICLRKGGMHDTCALIHLLFYGECHQHCYRVPGRFAPNPVSPSFISSPGPKVQVNYCHHLASVVCRL